MSKRGEAHLYVFLAFAAVALLGLTYTMLNGAPVGFAYHGGPYDQMPLNPNQLPDYYATGMPDQPGLQKIGTPGSVSDCQSQCFGTQGGRPRIGQQPLGGSELRQCLSDCQAGILPEQSQGQECYMCSCPSEGITADNQDQANVVCQRVCGSSGKIVGISPNPCNYG